MFYLLALNVSTNIPLYKTNLLVTWQYVSAVVTNERRDREVSVSASCTEGPRFKSEPGYRHAD